MFTVQVFHLFLCLKVFHKKILGGKKEQEGK